MVKVKVTTVTVTVLFICREVLSEPDRCDIYQLLVHYKQTVRVFQNIDTYHIRLLHYKCVEVLLLFSCSVHPFMTLHLIKSHGNINPCFPTGL
jgi:hypothetical protein